MMSHIHRTCWTCRLRWNSPERSKSRRLSTTSAHSSFSPVFSRALQITTGGTLSPRIRRNALW